MRVRLRRLREPRYLIGAIVGAAYLYFSFFARFRASRAGAERRGGRPPRLPQSMAALLAVAPALAASRCWWPRPGLAAAVRQRPAGLLASREAVPVSGAGVAAQLLVHRLHAIADRHAVRRGSSASVVATSSPVTRLRISIASWLILSPRRSTSPASRWRARAWRERRARAGGVAAVQRVPSRWRLWQARSEPWRQAPPDGARAGVIRIGRAADTPAARIVLWPFMALARPLFAHWPGEYLVAIARALSSSSPWWPGCCRATRRSRTRRGSRGAPKPAARRKGAV